MILQKMCSGNSVLNFSRIAQVLEEILQNHFGLIFSGHSVLFLSCDVFR